MALGDFERAARGKRPRFHDDPAIDQLVSMVVALTQELSVTRDRLATLERILARAGTLDEEELESFRPSAAQVAVDAERQARLLRTVFYNLNKDVYDLAEDQTAQDFESAVEQIGADR